MSHILENGDQIEILTSENQTPKLDWLKYATSAKARTKIKDAFKLEKNKHIEKGRVMVEEAIKKENAPLTANNLKKIIAHYNLNNKEQLYSEVGTGLLELNELPQILGKKSQNKLVKYWNITFGKKKKDEAEEDIEKEMESGTKKIDKQKPFILKEGKDNIDFSLAKCCNPIPGEKVIGYLSTDDHAIIHKIDCKKIEKFLTSKGDQIITAEWTKFKKQSYLSRIHLTGFDRVGIVNEVSNVISKENNINMRSIKFDTTEGIFEGELFLYVHNTEDLNNLISRLQKIKGIDNVSRVENMYD